MPRKRTPIDIPDRAKFYQVCERTIRRWIDAKVDVHSLESVADYLIKAKNPSEQSLKTVIKKL